MPTQPPPKPRTTRPAKNKGGKAKAPDNSWEERYRIVLRELAALGIPIVGAGSKEAQATAAKGAVESKPGKAGAKAVSKTEDFVGMLTGGKLRIGPRLGWGAAGLVLLAIAVVRLTSPAVLPLAKAGVAGSVAGRVARGGLKAK